MTLHNKVGGAWKELSSLHVKINGEWKDINTMYSKKDGAWVIVFSSGALIEFMDYPYAIPVAKGWQYSTDGKTWTTVEEDVYIPPVLVDFSNATINWYAYIEDGGAPNNTDLAVAYYKIDGAVEGPDYNKGKYYRDYGTYVYEGVTYEHQSGYMPLSSIFTDFQNGNYIAGVLNATSEVTDYKLVKIEIYDSDYNLLQTYTPEEPMPSEYLGLTGKVGDWDFSKVHITGESSGYDGKWTYYFAFPYATGPDITKIILTVDGNSTEESVYLNYNMAYPSEGSGIVIDTGNILGTGYIVSVDFYSNDVYLGNLTIPYQGYGQYEGEVTYPPFTGFVKPKSELSLTEYANGIISDWDLSKIDISGESAGDGENWSYFYVFPYATGPDITKIVYTYEDGSITEVSVNTDYNMAWPSEGSGIVFDIPIAESSKTTVTIDYYSGNTHLATTSAPQINDSGLYECEVTYGPDIGVKIPVTEGSTYDINDWDVSAATYSLSGGASLFTLSGVTGSIPTCTSIRLQHESWVVAGFEPRIIPVTGNNPNAQYSGVSSPIGGTTVTILQLLDADGNIIADLLNPDMDTSITADVSKVLTFDSKVTGTIKYKAGDLTPAVEITVVDASGNVIEGAEITFEEIVNNWDFSRMVCFSYASDYEILLNDIYGSGSRITRLVATNSAGTTAELEVAESNIFEGTTNGEARIDIQFSGLDSTSYGILSSAIGSGKIDFYHYDILFGTYQP